MIKIGIVGRHRLHGRRAAAAARGAPGCRACARSPRARTPGTQVADMFPSLRGRYDLAFCDPADADLDACDVVFFATPHGVAMAQARELLDAGVRVIDLAADFRLKDPAVFEQWYGMPHGCPDLLAEAVYGLPELNREAIRTRADRRQSRAATRRRCSSATRPLLEAGVIDAGQPDRRLQVRRLRRRPQGRARPALRRGVGQLQGLQRQGASPPPRDRRAARPPRRRSRSASCSRRTSCR